MVQEAEVQEEMTLPSQQAATCDYLHFLYWFWWFQEFSSGTTVSEITEQPLDKFPNTSGADIPGP